jgi:hypothetical protein
LSQEQVPSLLIQHLPNRLRFTLQQKIARAAQPQFAKNIKYFFSLFITFFPVLYGYSDFLKMFDFAT